MIQIILDLPPSVNKLWGVNKSGRMYKTTKYSLWLRVSVWEAASQSKGQKITGPFQLRMEVVRPDKRKRDLDNLLKASLDCLTSAGVIADDSFCEHIEAKWVPFGPACTLTIIPQK